jgi:glutaredoxin 3
MKAFIYGRTVCAACNEAKAFLDAKGIPWNFGNIETNDEERRDFREDFPDALSVPQIVINGKAIGTLKQVKEYLK